jgi:hypothetical protein
MQIVSFPPTGLVFVVIRFTICLWQPRPQAPLFLPAFKPVCMHGKAGRKRRPVDEACLHTVKSCLGPPWISSRAYRATVGGERACNVRRWRNPIRYLKQNFELAMKFWLTTCQPTLFEIWQRREAIMVLSGGSQRCQVSEIKSRRAFNCTYRGRQRRSSKLLAALLIED